MLCKVKGSRKWYVRFTNSTGRRVLQTTGTEDKGLAREFERKVIEEDWRKKKYGTIRQVWQDAVLAYSVGRDITQQQWHLSLLAPYCTGKYLEALGSVRDSFVRDRLSQGVTNSTVNRTLEVFRAVLKTAERRKWCEAPFVEMLPEPPSVVRWITREEADSLISACPEHLGLMVRFALTTGLRDTNVTGLEWSRVDLVRRVAWVDAIDTKTEVPYHVPLNSEAVGIIRNCLGRHQRWVFTYEGERVRRINNTAWKGALKRSGIENFRVHDLRHTWASWHVMSGTSLAVLKELGGWKTLSMVMRYAHLAKSHIAEQAENICKVLAKEPTGVFGKVGK
jgi:integrase